jgi:hypothetical protein
MPSDFNSNGIVDAADYVLWRKGGQLANDTTPGVQPGDYNVWRSHFGQSAGSGSALPSAESPSAAVPEPAAGALALLGVSSILLRRRSVWRPNKRPISGRVKGAIG